MTLVPRPGPGTPRVVLVVEDLRSTGGQERTTLELGRRLGGEFAIRIVTASVASGVDDGPFEIHRISRWPRPEALRFRSFVHGARKAIHALRPDVVHGIGANCPGADVVHLQTINREKFSRFPDLVPSGPVQGLMFQWYLRGVLAAESGACTDSSALFIAVSKRVADEAAQHYAVEPARIRLIPNGVDCEYFRPPSGDEQREARASHGLDSSAQVIAFVGPDHRRKGLDVALRALAKPRLGNSWLISVGGADRSIAFYRQLAVDCGVAERVRFVPHGPGVRDALWAADVFLFPSCYDPFGMAAVEALACGVPLIAGPEVGLLEWLTPDESVVLDDVRDEEEVALRTGELLTDSARRGRMSACGRRRAMEFSWDRIAEQVARVWWEVINSKAQRISIASP